MPFTYEGPAGEAVFHDFEPGLVIMPGGSPDEAADSLLEPIREKLGHLRHILDFHTAIIYGALLVENALDHLLVHLMPLFVSPNP